MSFPLLLFCLLSAAAAATSSPLVNQKVDRVVDISTQLVKVTSRIRVANAAGQAPASSYTLLFHDPQRLSYVRATIASPTNEKDRSPLAVQRVAGSSMEWEEWTVDLSDHPIAAGSVSPLIEVHAVFTKLLRPHPAEIDQSEKQLVVYEGNHYFFSPYQTVTQTAKVKIPTSSQIESYSKLKPNAQSSNTIDFGPYEDIAPKSQSKMLIHYENNSPFLTVTRLDRTIEISHWAGVISVEEEIDVRHDGAVLRGAFSRYDFQREANSGLSAVKNFKTKLPASAADVYYRDEIGNISTSNLRQTSSHVVLDLRPRFPLFGGWKTHYVLGYSLPANDYLFNDGNQFVVRLPFVDHIYDNSVIEDCTVRIVLPEGAADLKLRLPFSATRERDQVRKTYLDTFGRTVVVLRKANLVENHVQDFEVHYTYNRLWMLQEPLLLVSFLFALCLCVILYVRLDFNLTTDPFKDVSHKVASTLSLITRHQENREVLYEQYDSATVKFKSQKDANAYQATLKRLNGEHKQETQSVTDLINRLKEEGASAELVDRIGDVQRLDRSLKEQLLQQSALAEKVVAGKMQKQAYLEADKKLVIAKQDIADRLRSLTSCLTDLANSC